MRPMKEIPLPKGKTVSLDPGALLAQAEAELARVGSPAYRESLWGSLGADWVHREG